MTTAPAAPSAAPAQPVALGVELHAEILRVRELSQEERDGTRGKLRCARPLAAEIRPDRSLQGVLAQMMGLPVASVPETVTWIFGRDGRCFQRQGPVAKQLDAVDAAARQAAPRPGEG